MILSDLAQGDAVFLDANILIFHFSPHPVFGPSCTHLLRRINNGELTACTSTHVLSETAHRLMMFEAARRFGWSSKVSTRLAQHPAHVAQLQDFRQSIADLLKTTIRVHVIAPSEIATATSLSQQFGLFHNDALLVAVMQANGLTNLASHDTDFDRVPGIVRFGPA